MKTQITKVMVAIMLLASGFVANAKENEREISLKTENSKSVILQMNNVKEGTDISLWNKEGKLLFRDEVKSNAYTKAFNLDQLNEGELILEVENDETLEVLPISVTKESAQFVSNKEKKYAKPVVRLSGDELKIFLREDHRGFKMRMTDSFNDKVYDENIPSTKEGLRRYDVSKLAKGKYNIQFTADGRSFYHTIIIK